MNFLLLFESLLYVFVLVVFCFFSADKIILSVFCVCGVAQGLRGVRGIRAAGSGGGRGWVWRKVVLRSTI